MSMYITCISSLIHIHSWHYKASLCFKLILARKVNSIHIVANYRQPFPVYLHLNTTTSMNVKNCIKSTTTCQRTKAGKFYRFSIYWRYYLAVVDHRNFTRKTKKSVYGLNFSKICCISACQPRGALYAYGNKGPA